ncbi:SH3 domain-containing protein [Ceratobasidium sp. AG-Ba]|nr:SH3 domain-containing protein [Ceratobasidium sp. AG-Ba]QRW14594.1 SH3 domain-containing protein [Ceratobasidium sp. AG-Ba]
MARLAALLLLIPAALAFDYTIGVGKDETTGKVGMGFDPSSVRPQPGDRIVFEYRAGSHSAVQSTFKDPCIPMAGGYNSGVQTVADGTPVDASGLPTTVYIVQDTNPVWFFDQAGGLCTKGAVFSINPELTGTQTAGQFRANAEASDPSTASVAPTSASSSGTATEAASTTGAAPSTSSSPNAASSDRLTAFSMGASLAALGAWLYA